MKIRQLIKSPQDLLFLFEEMVSWIENPSKSLWKEEDYPKLKPYFDFSVLSGREMNKEEVEAFKFWVKCHEEYGERNSEIRNNLRHFSEHDLADAMGIDVIEPSEDDPDWDDLPNTYSVKSDEYPYVLVMDIVSSWDRGGDFCFMTSDKVYLKEFG